MRRPGRPGANIVVKDGLMNIAKPRSQQYMHTSYNTFVGSIWKCSFIDTRKLFPDSNCIAPYRKGDSAGHVNYPKCQNVNQKCGGCDNVCAKRAGKKGRRDYGTKKERRTNGVDCKIICDGWPSRGCKVILAFTWTLTPYLIIDQGNSKGHMVIGILYSTIQLPGKDPQTISQMQTLIDIFLQTMWKMWWGMFQEGWKERKKGLFRRRVLL